MAGIENPGGGGGDYDVATAEEVEMTRRLVIGFAACMGCVTFGASGALSMLSLNATATSAVMQALAGAGIVTGLVGKFLGFGCCMVAGDMCVHPPRQRGGDTITITAAGPGLMRMKP